MLRAVTVISGAGGAVGGAVINHGLEMPVHGL
jgi:hypothetical protein